jgi:hypothetical protein
MVDRHSRAPVVGDLVIVPLRQHRNLGIERAQVAIEQIVFVVAAKIRERPGDPRLFLGDEVSPDPAVGKLALGGERAIGVDVVTRMDEKVGPRSRHGRIGARPAAGLVDPPPGSVARPDERN